MNVLELLTILSVLYFPFYTSTCHKEKPTGNYETAFDVEEEKLTWNGPESGSKPGGLLSFIHGKSCGARMLNRHVKALAREH